MHYMWLSSFKLWKKEQLVHLLEFKMTILRTWRLRKFFIDEDLQSSVFGNLSWTKIFGLRYSEIFHERRSSVFGIRKFFKNEDLRSSVFGNFSRTKIFGLRYSVKIANCCNYPSFHFTCLFSRQICFVAHGHFSMDN